MELLPAESLPTPNGSEAYESAAVAAAAATPLGPFPPTSDVPHPTPLTAAVLTSEPSIEGPVMEEEPTAADQAKHVPAVSRSKLADLLRAAKQLSVRGTQSGKRLPDRPLEESRRLPHRPISEDYWNRGDELLPHLSIDYGPPLARPSSAVPGRRGSIKDPNYGRLSPPCDIEKRGWQNKHQVSHHDGPQSKTRDNFHPDRLALMVEGSGSELDPTPPRVLPKSAKGANKEPLGRTSRRRIPESLSQKYVHDFHKANDAHVKREVTQPPRPVAGKPKVTANSVSYSTAKLSLECQKRGFNPSFKATIHKDGNWSCSVTVLNKSVATKAAYGSEWSARLRAAEKGLALVRALPPGKVNRGSFTTETTYNVPSAEPAHMQTSSYSNSSHQPQMMPDQIFGPISGAPIGHLSFQHPSAPVSSSVALQQLEHREQRIQQIEMLIGASIPWTFRGDDLAVQAFVTGLHLGEGKMSTIQLQAMVTRTGSSAYRERSPLRSTDVPNARGRSNIQTYRETPRGRSQSPYRDTVESSGSSAGRLRGDYYPPVDVDRYRQVS